MNLPRRLIMPALLALLPAGCLAPPNSQTSYLTSQGQPPILGDSPRLRQANPRNALSIGGQPIAWRQDMQFSWPQIYAAQADDGRILPAIPYGRINPQYLRQIVNVPAGGHKPGTIIVDRKRHYLYLILQNGLALRYGVGIGREGFSWAGQGAISRKAAWPQWGATPAMIRRARAAKQPLKRHMAGAPDNPMAARALYIAKGGRDTLYRIHGTPEWWTIGKNVSAGCFRMFNQDVVDLYSRAPIGARIIVE